MGLGRGLVKRVFCKSKSSIIGAHHTNERHFGAFDKSRWSSVRLYLCGDELNSVIVENDSASIRSSDASVMQPLQEDPGDEGSCHKAKAEQCGDLINNEEEIPSTIKFSQEEAAIIIQSAFRGFMARQLYEEARDSVEGDDDSGVVDPSGVNEAASTEVLVDDESTDILRIRGEDNLIQHRVLHKSRSQVCRLKEEWDDSTLSGDTLRLRFQNKLEATTRRERALAYAFSQQLRTCTTKKKPAWSDSHPEPNTGWTWLERWMATRAPDNSPADDCWSKHLDPIATDRRLPMISKKRFDISFEGKESCGSNDVPVALEEVALFSQAPSDGYGHAKNSFKATKNVPRRKTAAKVNKRVSPKEAEMNKSKQVQAKSIGETKGNDAS